MKEYIEREALLELYQIDGPENETGHVPLPVIRQNIMDLPAADVAEVRHGRWIDGVCSECGFDAMYYKGVPAQVYTDYRPNCGARMDKEDEHETD